MIRNLIFLFNSFILLTLTSLTAASAQEFSNSDCQIPNNAEISASDIIFEQSTGELQLEGDVIIIRDGYCLITNFVKVTNLPNDPSIMETISIPGTLKMYVLQDDEIQIEANAGTYTQSSNIINLVGDVRITRDNTNTFAQADEANYSGDTRDIDLSGNVIVEQNTEGNPISVFAQSGLINSDEQRIDFLGDVKISAIEYQIEAWSENLTYLDKEQIMTMNSNVVVEQQTESGVGQIKADNAEVRFLDSEILFEGNVSVNQPGFPFVQGRNQVTYSFAN
ncbi:MAG: hypothetical protein OXC02_03845 [Rhodobacteraceae bacterium]|nr:hypothetical protein [Paracoccaceae bacterium]